MNPVELIENALHGKIVSCNEGVFLVHFGAWTETEYGIGYAVQYLETVNDRIICGRKDVRFKLYREQITREDAIYLARELDNPAAFENYINMEGHPRPRRKQIPLTEPLIRRLTVMIHTEWKGFEIVGQGRNALTAISTYGNKADSWSLMSDLGGLPSMAFPPMDMLDITAAQAERFSAHPSEMVQYFKAHVRKTGR